MPDDDRGLLARIACGDEAALQELYGRYRAPLWRYVWQQLQGDAELVDELLQDIFLAVWRQAGNFRNEASVATWLYRIARHRTLNALRDASRRLGDRARGTQGRDPFDDADAGADSGHQPSHEDEIVGRLELAAALSQLSSKHREVLELVFYHGFSVEETAQVLGVPVGTVKSRLSYARRALQDHLTKERRDEEAHHGA